MIIFTLSTALVLDSLWALIPAILTVLTVISRTALEDRTLKSELDGYLAYNNKVHYRLLPRVW